MLSEKIFLEKPLPFSLLLLLLLPVAIGLILLLIHHLPLPFAAVVPGLLGK